ncbi:MAG: hypothetical protein U5R31_09985 [Acidimicrobiia bacterium]|nr:hypothetical protein [Acidimicrobiia bacterium]
MQRQPVRTPRVLGEGDKFGMDMKMGVPYRVSSKVVEFEDGKKIAWCHFGGHRWRWELEPTTDGKTELTETFEPSTAEFPPALRLAGYPEEARGQRGRLGGERGRPLRPN